MDEPGIMLNDKRRHKDAIGSTYLGTTEVGRSVTLRGSATEGCRQ